MPLVSHRRSPPCGLGIVGLIILIILIVILLRFILLAGAV